MKHYPVSIIIPTTRKKLLLDTLDSLGKQEFKKQKIEIIVVGKDLPKLNDVLGV